MKVVHRDSIRFEFVGYGWNAEGSSEDLRERDRLYLDVGNQLGPGIIDHHQLAACTNSASSLALRHPDLIVGSLRPDRGDSDPFTIVLHESPDLDCLGSAYLAISLLTTGEFPAGSESLAQYVDEVDAGYLGLTQDNPYALYSAHMLLCQRLSQRNWRSPEAMWTARVRQGLELLDFVMQEVAEQGAAIADVDAFNCPEHFGPADREEISADLTRYRKKLADPKCHSRAQQLRLPRLIGGTAKVDALFVRDVQNADDPQRVAFFKDWARTDYVALSVFQSESGDRNRRAVLSVAPQGRVCLRGLGALLDEAESAARMERYGCDDRVEDPQTHEPLPKRPGYDNADPWYDGRAHTYTIVDSPRSGTLLSADRIEQIFRQYGGREEEEAKPVPLPSPMELSPASGPDPGKLRQMTTLAQAFQEDRGDRVSRQIDVFVSYPRARLDWVVDSVYEPLRSWRTAERVFFDQETIPAGAGWLATLAEAVDQCRVFLPLFCPEFFRSDFCQWELQLAMRRDPTGARRIIVPLMVQEAEVPVYCSLIQYTDVTGMNVNERVVDILSGILGA